MLKLGQDVIIYNTPAYGDEYFDEDYIYERAIICGINPQRFSTNTTSVTRSIQTRIAISGAPRKSVLSQGYKRHTFTKT